MANGMLITKIKTGTAVLLLVLVGVCAAAVLVAYQEPAEKQAKKEDAPNAPAAKPGPGGAQANKTQRALPPGARLRFGMASIHHGMAGSAAFSPDGTILATRNNIDIRLWDLKTRILIRTLARPQDKPFSPAKAPILGFSPDGKQFYELYDDLVTFDVVSGKELTRFTPPELAGANAYACSPDHKFLATKGPQGGTIVLWKVDSREKLRTIAAHRNNCSLLHWAEVAPMMESIYSGTFTIPPFEGEDPSKVAVEKLAFSPDGKWLASMATGDRFLRVFDVQTGKEKQAFESPFPAICNSPLVFSPDGCLAAYWPGPNRKLMVWDVVTGKVRQTFNGAPPAPIRRFATDDLMLQLRQDWVRAGMRKEFEERFQWKPTIRYPMEWLFSPLTLAFSADGKWIAGVGDVRGQDRICVWDRASGNLRFTAQPRSPGQVVFSPDGNTLVGTGWSVDMWDLNTGRSLLSDEGHTYRIDSFALSSDGSTIATNGMDNFVPNMTVRVWDARTGTERQRFEVLESAICFSPDGKSLLGVQNRNVGQSLVIWDIATKKERRFKLPSSDDDMKRGIKGLFFRDGVFSPDGKSVAVSVDNGPIYHFIDVATGKETHRPCGLGAVVVGIGGTCCWSSDGRHFAGLYFKGGEHVVALWDMAQPEPRLLNETKMGRQPPENLAFSADGKLLAWSNHTHQIHLWDLFANRELKTFAGRGCLAFSPDGRYLAAGKDLHPLDDKSPPLQLPVWPAQLGFGPDGATLVVLPSDASQDQSLLVFDLRKLQK